MCIAERTGFVNSMSITGKMNMVDFLDLTNIAITSLNHPVKLY